MVTAGGYRFKNTPKACDVKVADYIAKFTELTICDCGKQIQALAVHDAIVETHGAIKQLSMSLLKITGNGHSFISKFPRSGIGKS